MNGFRKCTMLSAVTLFMFTLAVHISPLILFAHAKLDLRPYAVSPKIYAAVEVYLLIFLRMHVKFTEYLKSTLRHAREKTNKQTKRESTFTNTILKIMANTD